jgi:hypothetical protein
VFLILSLIPCSLILLLAAFVIAFAGSKGMAIPCVGLGAAAFVIGYMLVPLLATA